MQKKLSLHYYRYPAIINFRKFHGLCNALPIDVIDQLIYMFIKDIKFEPNSEAFERIQGKISCFNFLNILLLCPWAVASVKILVIFSLQLLGLFASLYVVFNYFRQLFFSININVNI